MLTGEQMVRVRAYNTALTVKFIAEFDEEWTRVTGYLKGEVDKNGKKIEKKTSDKGRNIITVQSSGKRIQNA